MATNTPQPAPLSPAREPGPLNPSRLPVEPEFGPMPPAAEPEELRAQPPVL